MNVVETQASSIKISSAIDLDTFAELMEASTIIEKIGIGVAMVFKAMYATFGSIVLVNTPSPRSAVMYM